MSKLNATEKAVYNTAIGLLRSNNTITTLEIKNELRATTPGPWYQRDVSDVMDKLAKAGMFIYQDNGTHRVYSTDTPAPVKAATPKAPAANGTNISRTKAVDMIKNSKGHFFTVVFVKKDGTTRTMNCQYSKKTTQRQAAMGYITLTETSQKTPKNVNIQTIQSISIGGRLHKVK